VRYQFAPNFKVIAEVPGHASIQDLGAEQGVYAASPAFVRKHCGPIAKRLLDAVPEEYFNTARKLGLWPNVDVRIHRLYPGNFPAYPGWHCDGEYRETYFSQPDMYKIPVHNHLTATVSSHINGVSNTEFLCNSLEVEIESADMDNRFWRQVHAHVNCGSPTQMIPDGELVQFDSWTLHRCTAAKIRGWRLFFRMSMWHKPYLGEEGMLSKQEQVYLVTQGEGW
jgi:hypothetical protein